METIKAPVKTDKETELVPGEFKLLAVGMVVFWGLAFILFLLLCCDEKWIGRAASFGDAFGTLNSLFSAFALLAAITGILIQGREFRRQLDEMVKSAKEMETQTKIYETQLGELQIQTTTLREQLFEERFQHHVSVLPSFCLRGRMDRSNYAPIISLENIGGIANNVKLRFVGREFLREFAYIANTLDNKTAKNLPPDVVLPYDISSLAPFVNGWKLSLEYSTSMGLSITEFFTFPFRIPEDYFSVTNRQEVLENMRKDLKGKFLVKEGA